MPLTRVKLKIKPEEIPRHEPVPAPAHVKQALAAEGLALPLTTSGRGHGDVPKEQSLTPLEVRIETARRLIEGGAVAERAVEQPSAAESAAAAPLEQALLAQLTVPWLPEVRAAEPQHDTEAAVESKTPAPAIEVQARRAEERSRAEGAFKPVFRRVWRIPRVRLRDSSKLEGAELPLPPVEGGKLVKTPSGYLVLGDSVVRVYAEKDGPWGPLQPLTEHTGTQEVFVRELDGEVYITAGIEGRRYIVELPRELLVERLVQRIAIEAGIPLSERNPQDSGEFRGWRVNLALPQLAGGWHLSAARVVRVEPFKAEPLLLARLVALTASPNSVTFVGPPGSGKTTALIGVLNFLLAFWPRLRVSIVEEEPEVATQVRGANTVSYFSFGDRSVTANIRATRRYDRPDILVVGELRGEEVPSWFEAAGSGIPVLTTAHSKELADALKRLNALIQASGLQASVIDAVRVWVVCGKVVSSEGGIQRGVQAVYVVDAKGFTPVYKGGRYLPEEEFLALLPPELQLSLEGSSESEKAYGTIKKHLDAGIAGVQFERMEPLLPEEVS